MSDTRTTPAAAPPRSVTLLVAAVGAQVAFSVLYAVLEWASPAGIRQSVLKQNAARAKPAPLCDQHRVPGCLDVSKTVHSSQLLIAVGTVLGGALVTMLVLRLRRGSRTARSMYVVFSVIGAFIGFVGSPLSVLALSAPGPTAPRVASLLAAAASLTAIVLSFRRDTTQFLDAHSPAGRAGSRPGLGALFRPPARPAAPQPGSGLSSSAASRAERRAVRAKGRNDADAIARGAELARSRAKAAKSRRSES